jgi:uncharacterized protein (TIGR00251 family)
MAADPTDGQPACEATAEGTRLRLKVRAGARASGISGTHDGALRVQVTAPPEKGKANKQVVALLAEALSLPKASIAITAGQTNQKKTVKVRGLAPGETARRLRPS